MSPLRIEIAMSLGVLYFEVQKDVDSALAIGEDTLNEMLDAYLKEKDSQSKLVAPGWEFKDLEVAVLVQALKENLSIWKDE